MKKYLVLTLIIQCVTASVSFAQAGHGMMREHGSGHGMTQHHQMMEKGEHMMAHKAMMDDMTDTMLQLSGMMSDMAGMMEDMPQDKMHAMSAMMKDLCSEMTALSGILDRGASAENEMSSMHNRMSDIRKRLSDMMQ